MNTVRVNLRASRTSWPRSVLLRRALWQGLLSPVVRWLPRLLNPLRVALLRAAGAKIGKYCLIQPGLRVLIPWKLEIGDFVTLGRDVELYNHAWIRIKSQTVISQRSFICTSSHDYTRPDMPLIYSDINIGEECWVAAEAFIGPGVTIGDGSIIGARSVVSRSMPERMVCVGNPCRPIKPRILRSIPSPD